MLGHETACLFLRLATQKPWPAVGIETAINSFTNATVRDFRANSKLSQLNSTLYTCLDVLIWLSKK